MPENASIYSIISLGKYNGIDIGCRPEDQFINATAMCQANGKAWANFWKNEGTQEAINEIAENLRYSNSNIIISVRGKGKEQGTWVHRQVALKLAAWLNPKFEAWVWGQIDSILLGKQVAHREVGEHQLAVVQNAVSVLQEKYESLVLQIAEAIASQKRMYDLFAEMLPMIKRIDERTQGIREGFSNETKRMFDECCKRYYGGRCPCCQERMIFESGKKVTYIYEYEHYHHRSMNRPEHGWVVCKSCNGKLKNRKIDGFWFQAGPAFLQFQRLMQQRDLIPQLIPGLLIENPTIVALKTSTPSWLVN